MKKTYYLDYDFLGIKRQVKTESLFTFAQALDNAMDNPHVPNDSIDFHIEEDKEKKTK